MEGQVGGTARAVWHPRSVTTDTPFDSQDAIAGDAAAAGLCAFLDASPTPFHACATAAAMLDDAGFRWWTKRRLAEQPGRYYLIRGGSLIAWHTGDEPDPAAPFRIVGAHTDSPGLRMKPDPTWPPGLAAAGRRGLRRAVALDLDRPGSGSGRPGGTARKQTGHPAGDARRAAAAGVQLAIHFNRHGEHRMAWCSTRNSTWRRTGVSATGPAISPGTWPTAGGARPDILGWDLMAYDLTPARRIGRDRALIAGARMDNQATCYAGVRALIRAGRAPARGGTGAVRP